MNGVVVRSIERADAGPVERLARFGVATLHEAQGRVGLMRPFMRPVYPGLLSSSRTHETGSLGDFGICFHSGCFFSPRRVS